MDDLSNEYQGNSYKKVEDVFTTADQFATAAYEKAESFVNALNSTIYAPPTLTVTWNSIAPPSLDAVPELPTLPTIEFVMPGDMPTPLTLAEPNVNIDDFTEAPPVLENLTAPTINYGTVPVVPSVGTVAVPDAPTLPVVAAPTLLSLQPVTFAGVNLREDFLAKLEDIPALELVEPTPYSYSPGPEYASALLTQLKGTLQQRMAGGTGLPAAVEQAIWDRARDRETNAATANQQEVLRQGDSLGFKLPPGVVVAQVRQAQQAYFDKLSDLSREVGIKQADLEQQNMRDTVTASIQLESKLIDYSYQLERLGFDNAKAYADNAIQVHNAAVERFRALLQGYETYARAYDTIIKAELSKVEVYKAQMEAEKIKADVNKALVDAYKAEIEAGLSQVEIYRAQVQAAQTLIELEKTKVNAAGEQIRAYVAQVNAETAKVEAYKAQVTAEATKVDMYRTKAQAFSAKVSAQADRARAEISRYSALYQAKSSEWESFRARVAAESERIRALGLQSSTLLDGFRASTAATVAKAEVHTKVWESQIKQYEAGQNIALQTAKVNNDALMMANNARLDAAKVGSQVFAQLTSSALGMMRASASVSGGGSTSVSYSYRNDTDSTAPTVVASYG